MFTLSRQPQRCEKRRLASCRLASCKAQCEHPAEGRDWRTAFNKALARAIEAFKKLFRRGQPALRAKRLDLSL